MNGKYYLEMSFDPRLTEKGAFLCWLSDDRGNPVNLDYVRLRQVFQKDPTTEVLISEEKDASFKQTIILDGVDDYIAIDTIAIEMWRMFLLLNKIGSYTNKNSSLSFGKSFEFWMTIAKSITILLERKQYYPTIMTVNKNKHVYAYAQWMLSRNNIEESFLDNWIRLNTETIFSLASLGTLSTKVWLNLLLDIWVDQIIRNLLMPNFSPELSLLMDQEISKEIIPQWYHSLLHDNYDFFYIASDRNDIQKLYNLERKVKNWHSKLSTSTNLKHIAALKDIKLSFIKSGFSPDRLHVKLNPIGAIDEANFYHQNWELEIQVSGYEDNKESTYAIDDQEVTKSHVKKWVNDKVLLLSQMNDMFHELISESRKKRQKLTLPEVIKLVRNASIFDSQKISIHLPKGLEYEVVSEEDLNVSLEVSPTFQDGRVGLQSLLQFKWHIKIGDQEWSVSEFKAMVEQEIRVTLRDNKWVLLPFDEMLEIYAELKDMEEEMNQQASVATLLQLELKKDEALDVIEINVDESIGNYLDQLLQPIEPHVYNIPEQFIGTLRPYQELGFKWLRGLYQKGVGGCLADDMGLGKTIQAIAYILSLKETGVNSPVLIICPTSVLENWKREIETFSPSLSIYMHHGKDRFVSTEENSHEHPDVVVTSYSLVVRDASWFLDQSWDSIIIDEAQYIKNTSTKQSQYIRKLKANHRIALTGTPMENKLDELWAIMEFLNPGYLGSLRGFRKKFITPIEKGDKQEKVQVLQKLIKPFILRRTKTDKKIINDLPDKHEQKLYCKLSSSQGYYYQSIVEELTEKMQKATGIERKGLVLAAISKLKQVCNYPFYNQTSTVDKELSGKLQMLYEVSLPVIKKGDKILVFTQYVRTGKILEQFFNHYFSTSVYFLHGGLSSKKREQVIGQFRKAKQAVMILSIKSGGVGLNLTEANYVFHYDRWWNPAVENQATDRAYRIGQDQDVHVYKFITNGTLEEGIDKMIEQKQGLSDKVISAEGKWITEMTDEEVMNLIRLREQVLEKS
jgi:SNF2 family DNA or RNA helicase